MEKLPEVLTKLVQVTINRNLALYRTFLTKSNTKYTYINVDSSSPQTKV